jgi:hypothetical protein
VPAHSTGEMASSFLLPDSETTNHQLILENAFQLVGFVHHLFTFFFRCVLSSFFFLLLNFVECTNIFSPPNFGAT